MSEEKLSISELRGRSEKELRDIVQALRRKIMSFNMDAATSKEGHKSHLRAMYRHAVARVMTVMHEKKRGN